MNSPTSIPCCCAWMNCAPRLHARWWASTVVEQLLIGLLAGGHCLLEGAPGLGKTLLVRSLGQALELQFRRVQFTPT